jgi:hypothetical protein
LLITPSQIGTDGDDESEADGEADADAEGADTDSDADADGDAESSQLEIDSEAESDALSSITGTASTGAPCRTVSDSRTAKNSAVQNENRDIVIVVCGGSLY